MLGLRAWEWGSGSLSSPRIQYPTPPQALASREETETSSVCIWTLTCFVFYLLWEPCRKLSTWIADHVSPACGTGRVQYPLYYSCTSGPSRSLQGAGRIGCQQQRYSRAKGCSTHHTPRKLSLHYSRSVRSVNQGPRLGSKVLPLQLCTCEALPHLPCIIPDIHTNYNPNSIY